MFRSIKIGWHKARALGALHTYLDQPFKEPLPPPIDARLKQLSRQSIERGGTPIDTALTYYTEFAERMLDDGVDASDLSIAGATGRCFALRDRMNFYADHFEALKRLGDRQRESGVA